LFLLLIYIKEISSKETGHPEPPQSLQAHAGITTLAWLMTVTFHLHCIFTIFALDFIQLAVTRASLNKQRENCQAGP